MAVIKKRVLPIILLLVLASCVGVELSYQNSEKPDTPTVSQDTDELTHGYSCESTDISDAVSDDVTSVDMNVVTGITANVCTPSPDWHCYELGDTESDFFDEYDDWMSPHYLRKFNFWFDCQLYTAVYYCHGWDTAQNVRSPAPWSTQYTVIVSEEGRVGIYALNLGPTARCPTIRWPYPWDLRAYMDAVPEGELGLRVFVFPDSTVTFVGIPGTMAQIPASQSEGRLLQPLHEPYNFERLSIEYNQRHESYMWQWALGCVVKSEMI